MSVHNHVRYRDDMLDGMVDSVFDKIDLPGCYVDWRAALRLQAVSLRQVLLQHPWAVGLMESRSDPGVATLRHHDWVLGGGEHPFLPEMMPYAMESGYCYGSEFEFGLELILDGIEKHPHTGEAVVMALRGAANRA